MLAKDRIGKKYNNLEVLDAKRENKRTYVYCLCHSCGKKKWMRVDALGVAKTCGCIDGRYTLIDIAGQRQIKGRLTAISPTSKRTSDNGCVIWKCKCDCGNYVEVAEAYFKDERIKSCGCIAEEYQKKQGEKIGEITKEKCIEGTNVRNLTSKLAKNNTSGYKGVTYRRDRSKWVAQIAFKGKNYNLGSYDNIEDAVKARKIAEDKMFGEFLERYEEVYERKETKSTNK